VLDGDMAPRGLGNPWFLTFARNDTGSPNYSKNDILYFRVSFYNVYEFRIQVAWCIVWLVGYTVLILSVIATHDDVPGNISAIMFFGDIVFSVFLMDSFWVGYLTFFVMGFFMFISYMTCSNLKIWAILLGHFITGTLVLIDLNQTSNFFDSQFGDI